MTLMKINKKYAALFRANTRYIYLHGGRGSGKSFAVADAVSRLCYEPGHKVLFTRYTAASASKSIIPEFVEKLKLNGSEPDFLVRQDKVVNVHTGSEILFSGIKTSSGNQTANLKSLQGVTTWVYEEFEEHPDEESFDTIDLSVREDNIQNRVILISNALHKKSWQYKRFFEEAVDTTHVYTNYLDNRRNLNKQFIRMAEWTKANNPAKYHRQFLGHHYEDSEDALWKAEYIHRSPAPQLDRVVVAIDPAVTTNANSDLTGIVVVGVRGDRGYVLEDASGKHTPAQWASVAVNLYHTYKADRVIGEVNNGGDMIRSIIAQQDKSVSYKEVRASRGKVARAEPVVSLYEQGLVYHTKRFPQLELQMTTWTPKSNESPDRVDALVWGLTETMLKRRGGWVI